MTAEVWAAIGAIGALIAAVVAIVAAFIAGRQAKSAREQAEAATDQAASSHRSAEAAELAVMQAKESNEIARMTQWRQDMPKFKAHDVRITDFGATATLDLVQGSGHPISVGISALPKPEIKGVSLPFKAVAPSVEVETHTDDLRITVDIYFDLVQHRTRVRQEEGMPPGAELSSTTLTLILKCCELDGERRTWDRYCNLALYSPEQTIW